MPYDARPVSEGGNRGIDAKFSRVAPMGKFRVIGVDTFDGGDWLDDDFDSLEAAVRHVEALIDGKQMLMMYIYDDTGKYLEQRGTF